MGAERSFWGGGLWEQYSSVGHSRIQELGLRVPHSCGRAGHSKPATYAPLLPSDKKHFWVVHGTRKIRHALANLRYSVFDLLGITSF